ncbi:hypothetical protein [Natronosalvus rutilus]|uniref:Uncharacterized protein n=1 Tax=Natronosalvus rutilus TaxID=2953753 RepID=A0A9E7NEU8_9EURY|nr:hypothetical protein [Natronosalvus rutilus]UTF55700.1 hypothetical protein NGM29_18575 [Natronosalvus rutilus]
MTDVVGDDRSIVWNAKGTKVAFVQEVSEAEREENLDTECEHESPDPRVIDRIVYRSAGGYMDGKCSHVYVVDIKTGDVARITSEDVDYDCPGWDSD